MLMSEEYRTTVTDDSHNLHWSSGSVLSTQARNSVPDTHDRDKPIEPRCINLDRHIAIPSSHAKAGNNEHFSFEIDFGARCRSNALPQRIPRQLGPDYGRCLGMLLRLVKRGTDSTTAG